LGKKRKQEIGIFTNNMSIFSNNFFCFTVSILFIEKTNKVNFECVYDVGEVNIVCLIAFGNNMRMKDLRKCNLNTNRTINSLQPFDPLFDKLKREITNINSKTNL
jgi:hypothetical protein